MDINLIIKIIIAILAYLFGAFPTAYVIYKIRRGMPVSLASLVRIQNELDVDLGRFLRHYSEVELVEISSEWEEMYDVTILAGPDPYFLCEGLRVHNSDNVLALFRDKELREANMMMFSTLKVREGVPVEMIVNWDFQTMDFTVAEDTGSVADLDDDDEDGGLLF